MWQIQVAMFCLADLSRLLWAHQLNEAMLLSSSSCPSATSNRDGITARRPFGVDVLRVTEVETAQTSRQTTTLNDNTEMLMAGMECQILAIQCGMNRALLATGTTDECGIFRHLCCCSVHLHTENVGLFFLCETWWLSNDFFPLD